MHPNLRGAFFYPPGHFYSPLLDIEALGAADTISPYDGVDLWEHIQLDAEGQRAYFQELLEHHCDFSFFPKRKTKGIRYFAENEFFVVSDAFALSAIVRKERPRRIVEIGSGFSSAVMLDSIEHAGFDTEVTCIEPFPQRLEALIGSELRSLVKVEARPVQEVDLSIFDQLAAQDIVFVDSSHVAKIGSDLVFIFLRILPRLKPGVLVHFHDIFYPYSYPLDWIREGRAWNESLFVRTFLVENPLYKVIAFNSFAGVAFPAVFCDAFPEFLENTGGSFWLKKIDLRGEDREHRAQA